MFQDLADHVLRLLVLIFASDLGRQFALLPLGPKILGESFGRDAITRLVASSMGCVLR